MNDVLEKLNNWGCDVEGALKRMSGDEDFYCECLREIADDPYYGILKEAMDAGDTEKAFDAAHTLKGILVNTGLTPMYDKIVEIVEPLRRGSVEGLNENYAQLIQMRAYLNDMLGG